MSEVYQSVNSSEIDFVFDGIQLFQSHQNSLLVVHSLIFIYYILMSNCGKILYISNNEWQWRAALKSSVFPRRNMILCQIIFCFSKLLKGHTNGLQSQSKVTNLNKNILVGSPSFWFPIMMFAMAHEVTLWTISKIWK